MSPTLRYNSVTLRERKIVAELQGGSCAICRIDITAENFRRCAIDHDHVTGLVRGALCDGCNMRLGYVDRGAREPSPDQAAYLESGPLDHPLLNVVRSAHRGGTITVYVPDEMAERYQELRKQGKVAPPSEVMQRAIRAQIRKAEREERKESR